MWMLAGCLALAFSQTAAAGARDDNRVRALQYTTAGQVGSTSDARPGTTTIRIVGSKTPTFTMYKLEKPARVVIDLANATLDEQIVGRDARATWSVGSWSVTQVASHAIDARGRKGVRIIVTLARPAAYDVKADGADLVVVVTPRQPAPRPQSATSAEDAKRLAGARAEARAARDQAQAMERKAQKVRERADREIAAARAQARAARESAQERKRAAEAANRRAAQLEREAKAAREQAERAIAKARGEADAARASAEERVRVADGRMKRARSMMKEAKQRLEDADKATAEAKTLERVARKAKKELSARERKAKAAEQRLAERRAAAERAEKAARTYLESADAARGDRAKAAALRQRAEKTARAAEKRRAEAERAARTAEKARVAAERAAERAEARQEKAQLALRAAERQRTAAQTAVTAAEERRNQARAQQAQAEARRAEADKAAAEAASRAERARSLRQREEVAYRELSRARDRAKDGQRAAAEATAQLDTAREQAKEAKSHLVEMRKRARKVERRLESMSKRKDRSQRELAQLESEAKRLSGERDRARRALRSREREVARFERQVKSLERARKDKAKELRKVTEAADGAKRAREREEKLLAQLAARRTAVERELKEAERAAEKARAEVVAQQKAQQLAQEKARAAEKQAEQAQKQAQKQAAPRLALAAPKSTGAKKSPIGVRELSFKDQERYSRIVIGLAGDARPRVLSTRGRKAILEIPGTALPRSLQRRLDTSRYAGPIKSVSSFRDPRNKHNTRVVVELQRPAKSALKRSGSTYYWDFAKKRTELARGDRLRSGQDQGRTAPRTKAKKKKHARARSQAPVVLGGFGASSTPITQKSIAQLSQRKRKVYRGTKIDLDFKDADIHNLLRMLADVGGVNIVIPDEIQARVTVRLRRVPWDQALEVILASKGLWFRREGNLYRVAPRKQLDAEDEAEAQRLANLVKTEAPEPEIFTLNYAVAKELKDQLTPLLSPKGRIEVDSRTNSLIINDVRANRRRVIDMVRRLDTQTPQVQIEARIVEARSSFTREIGVQWGGNALASRVGGNATGLIFPNSIGISGGAEDQQTQLDGIAPAPSDFAVNLPAAVGSGAGGAIGLALGSVGGNLNLSLRLSALEDTGQVRIISAPKITVLNNVKAVISQGVSIPVSVISANGTQTQFVPADLSLKVTPHVSQRDCSVQMELQVEKNEPDFVNTGARGDPSILRKEASTTILVADGETTVIGGIYTRNTGLAYSKVPFFGDLPVIGWLFKSRSEADERSEVLVFITPKITNKAFLRCE